MPTAQGKAIRFPEEDIRATGRATTGVRGMKLAKAPWRRAMEATADGMRCAGCKAP